MTTARIANVSAWRRFRSWLRDKLHRCSCRILSTDEGIGGQCTTCGRIYGWMTREEIDRAVRMPHLVPFPSAPGVDEFEFVHEACRRYANDCACRMCVAAGAKP